jgi:hypothetical protein
MDKKAPDQFTELLKQVQACLERHRPIPCCAECRLYGTEFCAYTVNNIYSRDELSAPEEHNERLC